MMEQYTAQVLTIKQAVIAWQQIRMENWILLQTRVTGCVMRMENLPKPSNTSAGTDVCSRTMS